MADPSPGQPAADVAMEHVMGTLLRLGVLSAAAVVLIGALIYLVRHGSESADLHTFHGEPETLREPVAIVRQAVELRGRGIIQLGLLLLIATPVARVVFSVFAFVRQRDWTYVLLTLIVLTVLGYSLLAGVGG